MVWMDRARVRAYMTSGILELDSNIPDFFGFLLKLLRSHGLEPMNVIPAKAGIHDFFISFGLVPQN